MISLFFCRRCAMRLTLLLLSFLNYSFVVSGYHLERRAWLQKVWTASTSSVAGGAALAAAAVVTAAPEASWASQYCTSGVGEECESLAEGNDFIRSLQQKSAENRERYNQEALNAYNMKNYPDYFASIGKIMLKKSDGSGFVLVSEGELSQLMKSNRIALEMPTSMGGKVRDVTQKPIMVLKIEN